MVYAGTKIETNEGHVMAGDHQGALIALECLLGMKVSVLLFYYVLAYFFE